MSAGAPRSWICWTRPERREPSNKIISRRSSTTNETPPCWKVRSAGRAWDEPHDPDRYPVLGGDRGRLRAPRGTHRLERGRADGGAGAPGVSGPPPSDRDRRRVDHPSEGQAVTGGQNRVWRGPVFTNL